MDTKTKIHKNTQHKTRLAQKAQRFKKTCKQIDIHTKQRKQRHTEIQIDIKRQNHIHIQVHLYIHVHI